MLAWATGQIEPLLLQKLEFVLEVNRVCHALLDRHAPHWRLTNPERIALARKGMPLGQCPEESVPKFEPDAFFDPTRMAPLGGQNIVAMLVERHATFPIIVISGWPPSAQWVEAIAAQGHPISLLPAPFEVEQFYEHLSRHLGPLESQTA